MAGETVPPLFCKMSNTAEYFFFFTLGTRVWIRLVKMFEIALTGIQN